MYVRARARACVCVCVCACVCVCVCVWMRLNDVLTHSHFKQATIRAGGFQNAKDFEDTYADSIVHVQYLPLDTNLIPVCDGL